MPRSPGIIAPLAALLLLAVLTGCSGLDREPVAVAPPPAKPAPVPPVKRWLRWQDSVATMSEAQLSSALEGMAAPANPSQQFYQGLLRQQSDSYENWVSARDTFRQLKDNASLTSAQRQLAGILERFNQSRINWYHSREQLRVENTALQQELETLREQNALLEQKIQAVTELEATISNRKATIGDQEEE